MAATTVLVTATTLPFTTLPAATTVPTARTLPAATVLAPATVVAPATCAAPARLVDPATAIPPPRLMPPPNPMPILICACGLPGSKQHIRPAIKPDTIRFDTVKRLAFIVCSSRFVWLLSINSFCGLTLFGPARPLHKICSSPFFTAGRHRRKDGWNPQIRRVKNLPEVCSMVVRIRTYRGTPDPLEGNTPGWRTDCLATEFAKWRCRTKYVRHLHRARQPFV